MKYVRLYGDETGEYHFEDAEAELSLFQFALPSPPVYVSEPWTGPRFLFLRAPAGWTGDWHTAPRRKSRQATARSAHFPPGASSCLKTHPGKGTTQISAAKRILKPRLYNLNDENSRERLCGKPEKGPNQLSLLGRSSFRSHSRSSILSTLP